MSRPVSGSDPVHSTREAAAGIVAALRGAGHEAYFAGGCVRDELLGLTPQEFDVATSASAPEIAAVFPGARGVGAAFGVMLVRLHGHTIEVASFRAEGPYTDSRRPDSIRQATLAEDARRRDFTINGLYMDPQSGDIVDHVNGQADLAARILRAIGDPDARLGEDHLRSLRAVRFTARFALELDGATAAAIRRHATELRGVSRERVGAELRLMLPEPNRAVAAGLVEQLGLDAACFDQPHSEGELPRLRALHPAASFEAALAAWWLDRAERGGTESSPQPWESALMLSRSESVGLLSATALVASLRSGWKQWPLARRRRMAMVDTFQVALQIASGEGNPAAAEMAAEFRRFQELGLRPVPLLSGDDLKSMGFTPGPDFKRILDAVYDAQLEGVLVNSEQAREMGARLARPGSTS